jgi:hypothetical protein
MKSRNIFLTFTLVAIAVCFYYRVYDGTSPFLSTVNNNSYRVRDTPDKQVKADLLGMLHNKLNIIINSLKANSDYFNDVPVQRLLHNFSKGITIKEIGNMESDAAYVINKQYMSICLKDFSKNVTVPGINLLTYVGIHELAHIMSDEIGHNDEFKTNFRFLLNYSKQLVYDGSPLYIQLNLINTPSDYCGVSIINSIS